MDIVKNKSKDQLYNIAIVLSIVTIVYNLIEGGISVFFGMDDETLALLGFGIDSFVEVISGAGILHMVIRMKRNKAEKPDSFERQALTITGTAFYLLAAGLTVGAVINIIQNNQPHTTVAGIIISAISILTMYVLIKFKLQTGRALDSAAITADANCTKTCFYLSILLLASSGLYEVFRIGYIDAAGSIGIAYFAFNEGREAFEKVRNNSFTCGCDCDDSCEIDNQKEGG